MSDGPFKNLALSHKWKRYGEKLVSDAASPHERAEQAFQAMLGDVDRGGLRALYHQLMAFASQPQLELIRSTEVEAIFEQGNPSPLADAFRRHLSANLQHDAAFSSVIVDSALEGAVAELIDTTKNRLDEECIRARALGDMQGEGFLRGVERNRETFASISPTELCDALTTGKEHAFKQAAKIRAGVDEGPEE